MVDAAPDVAEAATSLRLRAEAPERYPTKNQWRERMPRDVERLERIQQGLAEAGLDAIACRLPENVLLLSGYWPMSGMSWAIVARGQEPLVIAPVGEEEWVERGMSEMN